MDEKKKLINLMVESLERTCEYCEICTNMKHKCNVYIPENADFKFNPDFGKCDFKTYIYKTLTIED